MVVCSYTKRSRGNIEMDEARAGLHSAACATDSHDACAHKLNQGYVVPHQQLNFRGTILCQCQCHSRCPLAQRGRVSELTWLNSCTCAGAAHRRSEDTRHRSAQAPSGNQKSRTGVDDAIAAVRAQSAGKNKAEITQLLKNELNERGIELSEPLIRSAAGIIAHPGGPSGKIRMLRFGLRALTDMGTQMGQISKLFEEADIVQDTTAAPYLFMPDQASGWVDVVVSDEGEALLRSRGEGRMRDQAGRDMVPVRLESGSPDAPGPAVDVYVEGNRVGTLAHDDAARYLPAISAAREHRGSLQTFGMLAAQHQQLTLRIPAAGTQNRS